MLTAFSSNAIAAKARAIYGKRLSNTNYTDLLRLSTVGDVCSYLKTNTSYSKYLGGVNEASIHRGQLEDILNRTKFDKYNKLLNFDFSGNKSFYRFLITNLEVSVIIKALMYINADMDGEIISKIPSFLQPYTAIDFKAVANIKNFDDLLSALKRTPYAAVIKRYNAPNGNVSLRECEHALKIYYYRTVLQNIDKHYKGKTRNELREIVLIEVELFNLSLMYRLRRYFNKPPEFIKGELLPFYYKLNPRAIDELLTSQKKEEYVSKMKLAAYASKMKNVEFNYIEDYTKRLRYIVNRKMMRFSSNAPISFYALMTLTQIEIENIIIIIEGIRYNTSSQVRNLLILE